MVNLLSFAGPARGADPDTTQRAAEAYYEQANQHFAAREYGEAIVGFEAAYELSGLPELLFNIAQCHRLKGATEPAIAYYRKYLQLDPQGRRAALAREHLANLAREAGHAEEPTPSPKPAAPPAPEQRGADAADAKALPPRTSSAPSPDGRTGEVPPPGPEVIILPPRAPEPKLAPQPSRDFGRLFLKLAVGMGFAYMPAGSRYEVAYHYQPDSHSYQNLAVSVGGAASAPLHGAVEFGVTLRRSLALSLFTRIEATMLNNADSSGVESTSALGGGTSKASYALAALLRVHHVWRDGRVRNALHLGVGLGQIRVVSDITPANTPSSPLVDQTTAQFYADAGLDPQDSSKVMQPPRINQVCLDKLPCSDTVALGYALISLGASHDIDIARWSHGGFGLVIDYGTTFTFGSQFGVVLDLQLGLQTHFL